jgi:hypothetical protein
VLQSAIGDEPSSDTKLSFEYITNFVTRLSREPRP